MCRFLAAGTRNANDALRWPAAKKRQGTKSRRWVVRRQWRGLWGFSRDARAEELRLARERQSFCCAYLVSAGERTV